MSYAQSRISFIPGINPEPDETKQNTRHIVDGNNVRFYRGGVEKIGGHVKEQISLLDCQDNVISVTTLEGCPRAHFSFVKENKKWQIIGTHSKLYAKLGSNVTNITPLKTTGTALATDPLALVNGDKTMTVTQTTHGLAIGDRIKLSGATHGTGGFANSYINREHIVATVPTANTFTVELEVNAPATDATEGGASVQIFKEIDEGECDAVNPTGPGIGVPGLGLPGSIQTDSTLFVQPRIWWMDVFGTKWVGGAGQGTKAYEWLGSADVAPTVIVNAPDADWGWVEDAKLVLMKDNIIYNSNTGDMTAWTPGAASSAYEDTKEDAHKLIGRAYVNGENIIFADEAKIFRMKWVGGSVKWQWQRLDYEVGIMGPNAHVSVGGALYIFARDNIYRYNGGLLSPLPDNTLLKYIYENINEEQRYKFFMWFNGKPWHELHMHYAESGQIENSRAVVVSLAEGWWSKREGVSRTAADRGGVFDYPILCEEGNGTYQHEVGYDDDTSAMEAYVQVAFESIGDGKVLTEISGMEPDLILEGSAALELYGKDRARGGETLLQSFQLTETTEKIDCDHETRWRSWKLTSNELGGFFRWGGMREFIKAGAEF